MSAEKQASHNEWYSNIKPAYQHGHPTYLDEQGALIEGIYSGLENDVYHSLDAYSSSLIKELVKNTPAHVYRHYFSDVNRHRTNIIKRTFDTGKLGHELTLEPDGFLDRYFKTPVRSDYPNALITAQQLKTKCKELGIKTSGSKAQLAKRIIELDPTIQVFDDIIEKLLVKEAGPVAVNAAKEKVVAKEASSLLRAFDLPNIIKIANKKPVDGIVWNDANRILETFSKHSRAPRLINDGFPELTVIVRCRNTGLMLKCKFDYITKQAIATDLKTTRSASPIKFCYQCKELRYDLQAAFYSLCANLAGIPVKIFAFISIEYIEADICEVFEFSKRRQSIAHDDCVEALSVLAGCLETDEWYGYTKHDEIMVIDW